MTDSDRYSTDNEQYRVIILGAPAGTYTDVEAACERYAALACEHCYTCQRDNCDCCTVQTWIREA